jgi:DNA (cytosine-5)-methyltransferase 1
MKALDLFAGVGWHIGASALGIEEEGVEIMREAVATRDAIGAKTVHDDVWTFDYATAIYEGHIASPPCQSFSMAGKGAGRKALDDVLTALWQGAYKDITALHDVSETVGDDRTALVLTPLHAWHVQRPEWVAWEQVPTVQPVWDACAEVMREAGYSVWTGRLQAEQYGVPQTRKRSILIASRTREVGAPTPTHSKYYPRTPQKLDEGVEKWMSMAEALGWALRDRPSPTVTGGGTETGGAEPIAHLSRYVGTEGWVYRSTTMANSARREVTQPAPTIAFGHDANSARWCYERPATTIVGTRRSSEGMLVGRQLPEGESRQVGGRDGSVGLKSSDVPGVRVTVREAGLLQSFPADTPWQGAKTRQYLQVGNAVPPGLAIPVLGEATGLPWQEVSKTYRDSIYTL